MVYSKALLLRMALKNFKKKKKKCHNDIGLCAPNIDNNVGSTINTIGSVHMEWNLHFDLFQLLLLNLD
jgi:hypothetical protein